MPEFKPAEQSGTASRLFWPSPQDYNEAVQTPGTSFADEELGAGQVETTPLGLPRSMSGNFASVFCFHCRNRKMAVRCFLHNIPDQQKRYGAISRYVLADDMQSTVPCEYLEQGIKIHGDWYPILKMEWVSGLTLNQFLAEHLNNGMALNLLASYFKEMTLDLKRHGIAHGDLQHDNIMISDDELRLVDYDGMYVPELAGCGANELGHVNYQHPARTKACFDANLDNFSAWVIYSSLRALSRDPSLWSKLDGGADCLLFRGSDFVAPQQSAAFRLFEQHPDECISRSGCVLRHLLELPLEEVPSLDVSIATLLSQAAAHANSSVAASALPEWFTDRSLESFVWPQGSHDATAQAPTSITPEQTAPGALQWMEAQPSVELVSDASQPLILRLANYVVDPSGATSLSPRQSDPATASPATPGASQSSSMLLPAGAIRDPHYAQFNMPLVSRMPTLMVPLSIDELKAQLLPNENMLWAQCMPSRSMPSSDARKFGGIALVVVWAFTTVMAAAAADPLTSITLVQIGTALLFCLAAWRRRSIVMLTDKRLLIARDTIGAWAKVQSIPLDEIASVRDKNQRTLAIEAKYKFELPSGPSIPAVLVHGKPSVIDQLREHLAALIAAQATAP